MELPSLHDFARDSDEDVHQVIKLSEGEHCLAWLLPRPCKHKFPVKFVISQHRDYCRDEEAPDILKSEMTNINHVAAESEGETIDPFSNIINKLLGSSQSWG